MSFSKDYSPSRDIKVPKKPVNAFIYYCAEHRKNLRIVLANVTVVESSKYQAFCWKKCLPASDKEKYLQMAKKDQERYKKVRL